MTGAAGNAASSTVPPQSGKKSPQGDKTFAAMLGEITWLLSQSPLHRHLKLADLEWLMMPPLILQQYRIFYNGAQPVGVAFWAYLNKEAEERLSKDGKLQPDDWHAGGKLRQVMAEGLVTMAGQGAPAEIHEAAKKDVGAEGTLWLVELIAPTATPENKLTEAMLSDLKTNIFPNVKIKFHHTDLKTGARRVVEV